MIRLLTKSPVLISIFPFYKNVDQFDKPVNEIIKPLDDELGWDRVKRIFFLNESGLYTKELQSIINVTLSGVAIGLAIGGIGATRNTVDDFITTNEATRFSSHFDAKRSLQHRIAVNFLKKGARLGAKLGIFCFIFSSVTTCTTAYRGKLAIENYILGGSVTGLLFKINLGFRAALVGTGLGGILGGVCGSMSILMLYLSGITIDEVLNAQQEWIKSRDNKTRERIKECMNSELPEMKKMYDENIILQNIQQRKDFENQEKTNS
ncbi:RPII140-upstream gene protein [Monomorium pharaonis]|uniref:RPII140-upstream gene protein n=1 Tax=Monomorium pharaonis TaxID=307658 RepID=UPI00063F6F1F|nr:RPII140-upstream gene protein [Monomorium pharaonis]